MTSSKRILPHVCGKCKDLILPPFKNLQAWGDVKSTHLIEVCEKCRDKWEVVK